MSEPTCALTDADEGQAWQLLWEYEQWRLLRGLPLHQMDRVDAGFEVWRPDRIEAEAREPLSFTQWAVRVAWQEAE